jgi:hypothetical protein
MTAANPQTAVAVIEPQALTTYQLDEFPEAAFNRIIPTQTIRMPSDLLVPVVQVVQLDPTDRDGKSADHYKSSDVPAGHRALTARGLNKVATAAAVSFYDEKRTDDGSNPDLIGVTVMASMLLPTGQRITAPGSKQVDLSAQSWASPAQRAKYKSFFYEHVSTRARNRAIRALLSLRASYRDADIAKPFAVVSFAPNMNHPAIRERYLDSIAPATAALYGPQAAAQLPAGEPVAALKEIPADVDDGQDPGSAGDDPLPAWATDQPAADAEPTLLTKIRDTAAAGGMVGGAKKPQIESLQEIFRPLGGRATTAGLQALWPELDVNQLSANQAQAVIGTSRTYETPEAFQAAWRAMAGLE